MTNTWITRSGNTVKVNFSIVGNGTMDKIGVKYVYLYEKNGTDWHRVAQQNGSHGPARGPMQKGR